MPAYPEPQRTKNCPTKETAPTRYFTEVETFCNFFYLLILFGTLFAIYK